MKYFRAAVMAACLAMFSTSMSRAEIKAEPLPAAQTIDKPISFSSQGLSVADTVAKFAKETGVAVYLENSGNSNFGGPEITYDVTINNLPSTEAVRELARALSLGIIRDGDAGIRLSPNSWSNSNRDRKPEPTVQLGYFRRYQSFPASAQQRDNLQLQFRIWSGKSPFAGPATIKVEEATDETGRSLLNTDRRQDNMHYGDDYNERFVRDQVVMLQYPDPKPKKIASIKGSAVISRPKTVLRITANKLTDAPQKIDFMGGQLTIGPVQQQGSGYTFKVALSRGKIGNDDWRAMYGRLRSAQAGTVLGPDGQVLRLQNRGSSSGDREVSADLFIMGPRKPNGADGESIVPATFQWDVVTETNEELVPFSLTNIDIP